MDILGMAERTLTYRALRLAALYDAQIILHNSKIQFSVLSTQYNLLNRSIHHLQEEIDSTKSFLRTIYNKSTSAYLKYRKEKQCLEESILGILQKK